LKKLPAEIAERNKPRPCVQERGKNAASLRQGRKENMIAEPIYTTGWLKLKCVSCGEKTRERVHHSYQDNEVFFDTPDCYSPKMPQHWKCHNVKCQEDGCKKLRNSVTKF